VKSGKIYSDFEMLEVSVKIYYSVRKLHYSRYIAFFAAAMAAEWRFI